MIGTLTTSRIWLCIISVLKKPSKPSLVTSLASAIKRLADSFSEARNNLEHQWDRGDQVNTEDLRVALRKYRSFFQKLMAV